MTNLPETNIDITDASARWVVDKITQAQGVGRTCYLYMPGSKKVSVSIDGGAMVWIDGRNIAWSPQLTDDKLQDAYRAVTMPNLLDRMEGTL